VKIILKERKQSTDKESVLVGRNFERTTRAVPTLGCLKSGKKWERLPS